MFTVPDYLYPACVRCGKRVESFAWLATISDAKVVQFACHGAVETRRIPRTELLLAKEGVVQRLIAWIAAPAFVPSGADVRREALDRFVGLDTEEPHLFELRPRPVPELEL